MNPILLDFIRATIIAAIPIIGVIWLADRNLKAARLAADATVEAQKQKALIDGDTTLKVKVIEGHTAFEQRVDAEMKRQDAKIAAQDVKIEGQTVLIEAERKKRFELEQQLQDSSLKIGAMLAQITDLEAARDKAIREIVVLNDHNARRKQDCEQTISHQHDQIVDLQSALSQAVRERDDYKSQLDNINNIGSNG